MDNKKLTTAVCKFASKDSTRHNINNVYFEAGQFVATDGHRIISTTGLLTATSFNPQVWLKTKEFMPVSDFKYPPWKSLYWPAKDAKHSFAWVIPYWVAKLEGAKKGVEVFIEADGTMTLGKTERSIVALDLAMLAPLAGEAVTVRMKDNNHPVRFEFEGETCAMIMPRRMEKK